MVTRLSVIAGCATAFAVWTAGPAGAYTTGREGPAALLHQRAVTAMLHTAGIGWVSSGHCTQRTNPHCTSFDGLRPATLGGILAFRSLSHCPVVISGGTETGHAAGRFSHGEGYKLDVLPNRCVDRFVRHRLRRGRVRGDGAARYWAPGATFAREPTHWDITFA